MLQREIMLFSNKLARARAYESKMQDQKLLATRGWVMLQRKTAQATMTRKRQIAVRRKLRNTENSLLQRKMNRKHRQGRIVATMAGDLGAVEEEALRQDAEHTSAVQKQNDDRVTQQYECQLFLADRLHRLTVVAGAEDAEGVITSYFLKQKIHRELMETRDRLSERIQKTEETRLLLEQSRFADMPIDANAHAAKIALAEHAASDAGTVMSANRLRASGAGQLVLTACEVLWRCSSTIDSAFDALRRTEVTGDPALPSCLTQIKTSDFAVWDADVLRAALCERLDAIEIPS